LFTYDEFRGGFHIEFSRIMSANEDAEKAFSDSQAEPVFRPRKWGLGILNDKQTDEVPGKL